MIEYLIYFFQMARIPKTAHLILGYFLTIGLYVIISVHLYAYFHVIGMLLKKRLGVKFGLLWIAIGLILLYNIVFNHFFAMVIKPGSPQDMRRIEKLRK